MEIAWAIVKIGAVIGAGVGVVWFWTRVFRKEIRRHAEEWDKLSDDEKDARTW